MRLKKALVVTVAAALLCTALCSCSKKDAASSSAATNETASSSSATVAEEENLTEFPSDCKLSEDDMKAVVSAYADYMTEALKADGYVVQARFEDDGSVHYDGTRTDSEGNTDTIKDLTSYDSVKDAFAYLYNCGQVDLEGNLLVGVSEGVEEAVSEATSEAIWPKMSWPLLRAPMARPPIPRRATLHPAMAPTPRQSLMRLHPAPPTLSKVSFRRLKPIPG